MWEGESYLHVIGGMWIDAIVDLEIGWWDQYEIWQNCGVWWVLGWIGWFW